MKLALAVLLMGTFLLTVAVSHADSADSQFLSAISAQGITVDRDTAIGQAHQVCDAMRGIQNHKRGRGFAVGWAA
jgi:hypothetical protein